MYTHWFYAGYTWIGKSKQASKDRKSIDAPGGEGTDGEMNLHTDTFPLEII